MMFVMGEERVQHDNDDDDRSTFCGYGVLNHHTLKRTHDTQSEKAL